MFGLLFTIQYYYGTMITDKSRTTAMKEMMKEHICGGGLTVKE